MSNSIEFRRLAEEEYDDAIRWYENRQSGLGSRFESEVQDILDVIAARPNRYPFAKRDVRHAPVHGFPYCVYYRVRSHRVVILSVFHESRDPKDWQSRA